MECWRIPPLFLIALFIGTSLSLAHRLAAQTTTSGALAGVVSDQTGAVIPEADVEIKDLARTTMRATRTDTEGAYRFSFLLPGRYAVTVSRSGFRAEKRIANISLGPTVSVNVEPALAETSTDI